MIDTYKRNIDYLRISITDRCNLRCKYCMPQDCDFIPHEDILSYEELIRICTAAAQAGICNIKVTGGEPLVRKSCIEFLAQLKKIPGIRHVTLTTNGVLLEQYISQMVEIGIDGINISLDTLDRETYESITGVDAYDKVMSAIEKAVEAGLRVKINCVPLSLYNRDELMDIANLAKKYPINVRFIEVMPIGYGKQFTSIDNDAIVAMLKKEYPDFHEDTQKRGFGPAKYFTSEALLGAIGFIGAINHNFCAGCNRIRLTSEGFLKLCLYSDKGCDMRELLRSGADDDMLRKAMAEAVLGKPKQHHFNCEDGNEESRIMAKIGG